MKDNASHKVPWPKYAQNIPCKQNVLNSHVCALAASQIVEKLLIIVGISRILNGDEK